jgi:U4/U6 small nuclear ribonucleoprotein PRP31
MDYTSTLAESLLDDLDDLSDNEEEVQSGEAEDNKQEEGQNNNNGSSSTSATSTSNTNESTSTVQSKRNGFVDDPKLISHLEAISQPLSVQTEDQEEGYSLMTASNKYLLSIQTVISKAHSDLAMAYKTKFPELEDLLPDPISYKNAIKVIQNVMDLTLVNEALNNVAKLSSNQIITLSVASSTTSGVPLTQSQLDHVNQCIAYIDQVLNIKERLIHHVEQHMEYLAPNMVALIGPTLAARMVSTAGGMAELTRIPSCNLQVLGQQKSTSASRAGLSTSIAAAASMSAAASTTRNVLKPHEGILAECDLYNAVQSHFQRKALKVIAAKLALCIRCDYVNLESGRAKTKTSGLKFRDEIESKFVKWEEPDKAQVVKALPKYMFYVYPQFSFLKNDTKLHSHISSPYFFFPQKIKHNYHIINKKIDLI